MRVKTSVWLCSTSRLQLELWLANSNRISSSPLFYFFRSGLIVPSSGGDTHCKYVMRAGAYTVNERPVVCDSGAPEKTRIPSQSETAARTAAQSVPQLWWRILMQTRSCVACFRPTTSSKYILLHILHNRLHNKCTLTGRTDLLEQRFRVVTLLSDCVRVLHWCCALFIDNSFWNGPCNLQWYNTPFHPQHFSAPFTAEWSWLALVTIGNWRASCRLALLGSEFKMRRRHGISREKVWKRKIIQIKMRRRHSISGKDVWKLKEPILSMCFLRNIHWM